MEVAPENGKESPHSARAIGMNEYKVRHKKNETVPVTLSI